MTSDIDEQLQAIFEAIDQAQADESRDESHPRRTFNIYVEVEDEEMDQSPIIESTLNEQQAATDESTPSPIMVEEQGKPDQTKGYPTKRQRRPYPRMLLFVLLALVGVLAGSVTDTVLLPLWTPSASITLVTTSQYLTTTSTLQVITSGTADPSKNQLPGQALPAITMSQQKTVPTTGITHQAAQAAHGYITFYNAATAPQTIAAGTALTGADGIQLVTQTDAVVPAAVFPTFGQATVAAHAAILGLVGNVRAADVYGACCRLNVSAVNGAFRGGQDARTYQSVTQEDITTAAASSTTSLEQSVQAALQAQVQPREALITPLMCTQKVTPDHEVGAEATQVTVTIEETCTGTTYSTQALTTLTTQQATQDAKQRLGTGYITTTGIQSRIVKATPSTHHMLTLQVESSSLWAYPFSQQQQERLKAMIAGMSKEQATATLLHISGVQSVSITVSNSTMLPRDSRHITILLIESHS